MLKKLDQEQILVVVGGRSSEITKRWQKHKFTIKDTGFLSAGVYPHVNPKTSIPQEFECGVKK